MKFKLALVLGSVAASVAAYAQVLDQSQTSYDGGMSARTLQGYSYWQSFTAGITGDMVRIDCAFFGNMNGTATLKVFAGEGTGGQLLETKTVSIFSNSNLTWDTWTVNVPVLANSKYTYEFKPIAGLPDPYGVCVGSGRYSRGSLGFTDPSQSSTWEPFDMMFKTYVAVPEPSTAAVALLGAAALFVRRKRR